MLVPTIILGVISVVLLIFGYNRGGGEHLESVKYSVKMILEILPLMFFAFIIAGMVKSLIPDTVIANWLGAKSGLRGIFIGATSGALMQGGPFVVLPVSAALFQAGASVGTIISFLTGWSLWAIGRLPMEFSILGWKITLIRIVSTFIFPIIAGVIAQIFFGQSIKT